MTIKESYRLNPIFSPKNPGVPLHRGGIFKLLAIIPAHSDPDPVLVREFCLNEPKKVKDALVKWKQDRYILLLENPDAPENKHMRGRSPYYVLLGQNVSFLAPLNAVQKAQVDIPEVFETLDEIQRVLATGQVWRMDSHRVRLTVIRTDEAGFATTLQLEHEAGTSAGAAWLRSDHHITSIAVATCLFNSKAKLDSQLTITQ